MNSHNSHPQETITVIAPDGREEELRVTRVREWTQELDDASDHDVGDECWVIEGLQPSETDLIPSRFDWLSGSLGAPSESGGKFPAVYIPKDSGFTVTDLKENDE